MLAHTFPLLGFLRDSHWFEQRKTETRSDLTPIEKGFPICCSIFSVVGQSQSMLPIE